MKTRNKALLLALCALLLVVTTVFATLAYLTDETDTVTNTFTVGAVEITLDEADVDLNGVKESEDRVSENNYKLIPGKSYLKDPTIHVDEGSEAAWVFAKIDTQAEGISYNIDLNKWELIDDENNVYAYKTAIVPAEVDLEENPNALDVVVFDTMTVDGNADPVALQGKTLEITGYAIQKQGFDSAAAAWTAATTGESPDITL